MSEDDLLDATYEGYQIGYQAGLARAVHVLRALHEVALVQWRDTPVEDREVRAVQRAKVSALVAGLRELGSHE